MEGENLGSERGGPRNIVIYSDGTGQRGGLYFDEERTNIYKLYRATRVAPDSVIKPDQQVAFYDPGLGTLPDGGNTPQRVYRKLYNFISQATGLGITRNIIDCYAALIRLWRPGDRIFLFGFSRGAYTVRCLASVICMCGIPTKDQNGRALCRDIGSSTKLASRAVKSVYQHVSSPRDEKYTVQRRSLAASYRDTYQANDLTDPTKPNAHPHFIGVFDTVASLSNTGSLILLFVAYLALHIGLAFALGYVISPLSFGYWFGWIAVWTLCALSAGYVYTHLKFALLRGYYFWDVIHLTDFRQKFYDQYLNPLIVYARHALSIDERRNDFRRVPWGSRQAIYNPGMYKIDPFEQLWFAGNHADIGGGYPENESRLSDLALEWMIAQATNPKLGGERLLVDDSVLHVNGRADGMQHDETRSAVFRWAKKTLREPVHDATLHSSVLPRFELDGVQQYDITAEYRPEALRSHGEVAHYYASIPPPHTTCWQLITLQRDRLLKTVRHTVDQAFDRVATGLYPKNWKSEEIMEQRTLTPDGLVSCLGLLLLLLFIGLAAWIFLVSQIIPWLHEASWHSYPLSQFLAVTTGWVGFQLILDWLFALPVTLLLALTGLLIFRIMGILSAKLYQAASRNAGATVTPSQTHA
jgi:uncharacterized protein (DUF2235 family)